MSHHTSDAICPLCTEKLATACAYMRGWFLDLKAKYANAHVSWAYRDAESQEQAFNDGKTKLHYPNSAHNKMDGGKPASLALDLFLLNEDGEAQFPPLWYAKVDAENATARLPILWGGKWKTLGDSDHFQYQPPTVTP